MRKIMFRGKRVHNGDWVYGCFAEFVNYLDGDTKPGIQVSIQVPSGFDRMIPAFETELVEVIPESVGQYTGLKDKNGVDIYEGDIVRWKDLESFDDFPIDEVLKVEYSDEFMKWITCNKNDLQDDLYDFTDNRDLEVIGNIYNNPELMEVEDENS